MAAYVKVAHETDLPPGQAMAVTVGDKRIALFSVDGTVVAIDDTCTHRGGPLSEGELKDGIVTCPWHGAQFNVKDGQALKPPAPKSVVLSGEDHGRRHRSGSVTVGLTGCLTGELTLKVAHILRKRRPRHAATLHMVAC